MTTVQRRIPNGGFSAVSGMDEEETGLPKSTVVKTATEYLPAGIKVWYRTIVPHTRV